jgi:mono/diheme cytochrome c family protein
MIILGYSALREPARLEHFAAAAEAREIETGAEIYDNNCATCHGENGLAQLCLDPAGNQIACKGIPLAHKGLVCGDKPERLEIMSWAGSKHDFIYRTVAAGRGAIMPTWSAEFGGPMRNDQIENVTSFVLNWESEAVCSAPDAPNYEWPEMYDDYAAAWQPGDPTRGEELYTLTYGCVGCHGDINAATDPNGTGPWLGAIQENAPTRIPEYSTEMYIYESVLNPGAYVVDGYANGIMPANFANRMGQDPAVTPQDLQDIIAYLLSK